MIKRECEIQKVQHLALFDAFYQTLRELGQKASRPTRKWLINKTLNKSAPQTFISYEQGQVIITQFIKGKYRIPQNKLIHQRDLNLYDTFNRLKRQAILKNEYISKTYLVELAIMQPTPRFYLSYNRARAILNQNIKEV